jgi:hypothetical protein
MKRLSYLLMTPLAVALFVGGACSSSGARADPLVSSATGFVSDSVTGVVGPWYSNADSIGPMASPTNGTDFADSPCGKGGFTMDQCSNVVSPVGGQPFAPTDVKSSKMCTNGTAAKAINGPDGTPDYGAIWGGEIALDFNNRGGDAGARGDFDLSPFQGIEFDFSGDLIPNNQIVNFPFTGEYGSSPPSWMGATSDSSPLTVGHNIIKWADVGGPLYLEPAVTPPPFDKTHVQTINFQAATVATAATPYSFCVANLALIPN